MKRIYAIAGVLIFVGSLSAQLVNQPLPKGKAPNRVAQKMPMVQQSWMKGACVLTEDFEGGAIPAGWDIGPQVEQQDQNHIGLGTFVDAWVVGTGTDANNGTFLPIPDFPPGNLLAYANDDGTPCNCNMDLVRLSTPELDFTNEMNMAVGFLGYNDADFGGGNMEIVVSTDQGAAWTVVETMAAFPGAWQNLVVDISAYDGMPSVMIGWQWTDNGSWATGVGVDNVCVAEILDYNMTMVEAFYADVSGEPNDPLVQSFEYTYLALDQAISTVVGGAVRNNGGMDMTNIIIDCEIFVDNVSQGVFSSNPIAVLIPGDQDTVLFDSGWIPSIAGDVDFVVSVRADSVDMNPNDNEGSKSQFVSDNGTFQTHGRDGNSAQSFSSNLDANLNPQIYQYGPDFKISNDAQVYGILVAFGTGSGEIVQGHLYDANFDVIDDTEEYEITGTDENGVTGNTMAYLSFDSPVDVLAQEYYTVMVEYFGGSNNVTIANSGVAPAFTTTFQDETGALFYTASVPMIRLVMAPNSLGLEEHVFVDGVRLGLNMPNPFGDNTVIPYELQDNTKVTFRVIDMNGKVIFESFEGNKPAGSYTLNFDGSELANGLYNYSIITEKGSVSKHMLVTK